MNNLDSGSYKYYTDYQPNQKGHFYLQVFDATTNQRLSKVEIEKQSIVLVDNLEENHWIGEFTVYKVVLQLNMFVELNCGISRKNRMNT